MCIFAIYLDKSKVISFICIVIIGFLEYRKISIRIDKLVEKVNQLEDGKIKIPFDPEETSNQDTIPNEEEVFEEKEIKGNDEEIKEDSMIDEGFKM